MNAESKINVHYSSLVGLKAELLRKQAEVEAAKAKQQIAEQIDKQKIKDKKNTEKLKKLKNINAKEDKASNQLEDIESIKTLSKSKLMLQAKSRLYEKLSKTRTNMNPNFLVDFEHKSYQSDSSEEEPRREESDHKSDNDSDSEWVEYTDCFGRTRKCLQEDLPKMQEKDNDVKYSIMKNPHEKSNTDILYKEDRIPEKEPEIEMMRKKWEEQTERLTNKANIHYQDILFDEARAHGVGYYAFSQDEEERTKQQENLLKLRKETEQKQKENQELQISKNKIQQNRLRVARLRQRVRAGLPPEEPEEETVDNSTSSRKSETVENKEIVVDNEEGDINSEINNQEDISKSKLQNIEKKIDAFEELLGKRNRWYVMSQEEWVQKKRKERIEDFAPTYENVQSSGTSDFISKNENILHNDTNDSDIIGPMPLYQDNLSIGENKPHSMETTNCGQTEKGSTTDSIDMANQIEAGLKYLRQQFEKNST